jgi:hypothetical protein
MAMEEVNDSDGWLRIVKRVVTGLANCHIGEAGPNRAHVTPFVVYFAPNRIWTSSHIRVEPGKNIRKVR